MKAGGWVCFLTSMKRAPSIAPVVEKLQQEPQMAWSFTGVTAPAKQCAPFQLKNITMCVCNVKGKR